MMQITGAMMNKPGIRISSNRWEVSHEDISKLPEIEAIILANGFDPSTGGHINMRDRIVFGGSKRLDNLYHYRRMQMELTK